MCPAACYRGELWQAPRRSMGCPSENQIASFLAGGVSRSNDADLEAHLATCRICGALLALLVENSAAGVPPAEPTEGLGAGIPTDRAGDRIGRYIVLQQIGAGATGVVYAARDPELERRVALKLLRSQASQKTLLLKEGQALARLSHPNVVTVFEIGTFRSEVFVALELVDGVTLNAWLRAHSRSWPEILEVFLQAGRGLGAAHAAGVVHRDFKPANVLVGNDGRVRVVDFGLAFAAASPAKGTPSDPTSTRTDTVVGTPAYMAPEQHTGRRADARSDQFAFGVALHEALHGERPFRGSTSHEVADAVVRGDLHVKRSPRRYRSVDEIVGRALRSDPADRFESMGALLDALSRASSARPTTLRTAVIGTALSLVLMVVVGTAGRRLFEPGAASRASAPRPDTPADSPYASRAADAVRAPTASVAAVVVVPTESGRPSAPVPAQAGRRHTAVLAPSPEPPSGVPGPPASILPPVTRDLFADPR